MRLIHETMFEYKYTSELLKPRLGHRQKAKNKDIKLDTQKRGGRRDIIIW